MLESILSVEACKNGLPTVAGLLTHPFFNEVGDGCLGLLIFVYLYMTEESRGLKNDVLLSLHIFFLVFFLKTLLRL